jgi:hypothetical protein
MANTIIQVKRSTTTAIPTNGSLAAGEIAYSYSSNVFFVGSADGNGILPVGGKFYTDKTNSAFDIAVASFNSSNAVSASASAAFDKANSANYFAYLVNANTVAAFAAENITRAIAVAAFANSNTKFSSSGGTINGDVNISGNLSITGNTIWTNVASFIVNDPLIYLAGNNYVSDIVDIGFVANYVNATGSNVHTGFFRDAGSKEYYVFEGYNQEPYNNVIDPTANGFTVSILNATLRTSNLILGGANALSWINAAFTQANNVAGAVTTANTIAVATFAAENVTRTIAIAAFAQANTGGGGSSNASNINSGTLAVSYGGTGGSTFSNNGILFGNTTGAIRVTASGTEGQVLQASSTGVPNFAMLDGGTF